eukprot:TRINITY_DN105373_c0_g1_i1.p1 TRINITY_DN105373_c0_g1~~TRINITY_DN105373_c0_g1_i1.p1  ORF type:complete len:412 (+),score=75.11 TRINITY_DN105373_c0_g1_i1:66-1238(+)
MAMALEDESVLIRECAGLYASFALESLANFLLGCTFCYLVLLIACKNQLENPGRAALSWLWCHASWAFRDWFQVMRTWSSMPEMPLDRRLGFCRKLNLGICIAQLCSSFLALTRWLHVGNINGFRYLGYAITCPLMQAELVVILAPYVPFFRLNVFFVMVLTSSTMICGWIGSLQPGFLWEDGSLESFLQSGIPTDIVWTEKGYRILPSFITLGFLIMVQIPYLALIYVCKGGMRANRDLPYYFLRLLVLVQVTWPAFGVWWFISAEGASIIHNTKFNTFGFCFLNMISKGGFTLMMLKLSRDHRDRWIEECVVTPKAANEDLWIVKQLRPYDPVYAQERKYTEADLEHAISRALAQQQAPSQDFLPELFKVPSERQADDSQAPNDVRQQ